MLFQQHFKYIFLQYTATATATKSYASTRSHASTSTTRTIPAGAITVASVSSPSVSHQRAGGITIACSNFR